MEVRRCTTDPCDSWRVDDCHRGTAEREQRTMSSSSKPDNTSSFTTLRRSARCVAHARRKRHHRQRNGAARTVTNSSGLSLTTKRRARDPASNAGVPVRDCPDCAGTLVRARSEVPVPAVTPPTGFRAMPRYRRPLRRLPTPHGSGGTRAGVDCVSTAAVTRWTTLSLRPLTASGLSQLRR